MATNNMYRVGDFVYVDSGPTEPFGIRRIDELQKSATGNVEVEVMVYYRRIDLPPETITEADENLAEYWDEMSKKYPTQVDRYIWTNDLNFRHKVKFKKSFNIC